MNSDVATGRWMKGVEMLMPVFVLWLHPLASAPGFVLNRDQPPCRGGLAAWRGVPLMIVT